MYKACIVVCFTVEVFVWSNAAGQACSSDQYAEWTIDSLDDPVMRAEVLSLYPIGLLDDTSTAELIAIPGRANCFDRAEFTGNGISVVVTGSPFDPAQHTLGYDRSQDVPLLCTIDGHGVWGTDGNIPRLEITGLNVTIHGRRSNVPKIAYTNLYEPNFCDQYPASANTPIAQHANCRLSLDRRRLYVHMMNSDGAGGYLVTWILLDGRYLGRVVEHGF